MAKIRVTRTLVYEGEEWWVRTALDPDKTRVTLDKPFDTHLGKIVETERTEETLPDA